MSSLEVQATTASSEVSAATTCPVTVAMTRSAAAVVETQLKGGWMPTYCVVAVDRTPTMAEMVTTTSEAEVDATFSTETTDLTHSSADLEETL